MELMHIIGFTFAITTGIVLGLIGGGGSMIILPIFIYFFQFDTESAILFSLFVVGFSSLVGSYTHYTKGNIALKTILYFGIPSSIIVILTRNFISPNLPEYFFTNSLFEIKKDTFLMLFFAFLMIISSIIMISKKKEGNNNQVKKLKKGKLSLQGLVVGFITGIIGAGGGFLIIPALVSFSKINMKKAVGTSLAIISINSLIGFFSSNFHEIHNYWILILFVCLSSLGIIIGSIISKNINSSTLKKYFAYFVLSISFIIIVKELLF
jgi:hypothetical protein